MQDADDRPNNDDWLPDGSAGAAQVVSIATGRRHPARPVGDLAAQLEGAPVVARPDGGAAQGDAPEAPAAGGKGKGKAKGKGASADRAAPPPDGPGRGRPRGEIWEGCPVKPLGVNGEVSYYLDRHGQLRGVDNHTAQKILHLFGDRIEALCWNFPQFDKEGDRRKGRFDQTSASMAMIAACSERGLFNPDGAVRGTGAWTDDDGRLIYHCGTHLITPEGEQEPGEIGGKIYPAYPPIPAPAQAVGRADPAADLLTTLHSWAWQRPDVAPMLALGMLGVLMLGGALDWRPVYWVTGDKAAGKSTLQDLIKYLLGEKGLVQSTDPTKSGITSRLGHSSLPVALDELEPGDEGSTKERDIITLARVAASGGQWLRGSADQKGASGNVYSAFLFSSILIPGSMGPQDRSRLITLDLDQLPPDTPKMVLDPRTWRSRGAALRRVLIDRWVTWAERLALWRAALAEVGLSGRNGDNWATTLAMADMALHEALPAADVRTAWAGKIARVARMQTDEVGSDAEDMLMHLIGQPFDVFRRGELFTVAHWIMVAAQLPGAPSALVAGTDGAQVIDDEVRAGAAKRANETLAKYGLRVRGEGADAALFIANKPIPNLCKLFERSRWAGGVWSQSSRRVPGAQPVEQPLTLAGQRCRGVYVPLTSVAGLLSFPMDRAQTRPEPTAPQMPADWEDFDT